MDEHVKHEYESIIMCEEKESTHGCHLSLQVCDFAFLLFQEIFFVLELAFERRNLKNKKFHN